MLSRKIFPKIGFSNFDQSIMVTFLTVLPRDNPPPNEGHLVVRTTLKTMPLEYFNTGPVPELDALCKLLLSDAITRASDQRRTVQRETKGKSIRTSILLSIGTLSCISGDLVPFSISRIGFRRDERVRTCGAVGISGDPNSKRKKETLVCLQHTVCMYASHVREFACTHRAPLSHTEGQ